MTRHTVLIVAYAVGACLLAWALRHPRAPEGTDPAYWTSRVKAGLRRKRWLAR